MCAMVAFPSVEAFTLSDYTKRRFMLRGHFGLEAEDYRYSGNDEASSRQRLKQNLTLNSTGFVWDPRFLTFGAGVSLLRENAETSDGNQRFRTVGYHLNTTWFGHRRHPLNVFANRKESEIAGYFAPTYLLTTEGYGIRWGFDQATLGKLSLRLAARTARSDNDEVPRDEEDQTLDIEGKRHLEREGGSVSDMTYGLRVRESEDRAAGNQQEQRNLYLYDRTQLSERAKLSNNVSYYQRKDVWQQVDADEPESRDSEFFSANSGLVFQQTEALRQRYRANLNLSEVGDTQVTQLGVHGGAEYTLTEAWEVRASAGFERREQKADSASGVDFAGDIEAGVRYSKRLERVGVQAQYSLGREFQLESVNDPRPDSSFHSVGLGLTHDAGSGFHQTVNYHANLRRGGTRNLEQVLRYQASGRIGLQDSLRGILEHRRAERELDDEKFMNRNSRIDLNWSHRFSGSNSLSVSGGRAETRSDGTRLVRRHLESRLTFAPRRQRRLRFSGRARAEEESSQRGGERSQLHLEGTLSYSFGRWKSRLRYRFRETETMSGGYFEEESIMAFLRRDFGFPF